MNRIKKVFIRIHIVLWILFCFMVYLQLGKNKNGLVLTFALILTCLYVFYGHFSLLKRFPGKSKGKTFYLGLGAIIVTAPFIYLFFQDLPPGYPNSWSEQYVINTVTIVIPFIFLSWLARVTENLVMNTVRKEQLEKQAAEAELHYLKSQINPHFLFNTLNNIHTLVYKQAPAAPEAVMHLASLMRYMLYESNLTTVPLTRELDYLQDYIRLQQLRYKQSSVSDLQVKGDTESIRIAPLLFIHLVENAYKYSPTHLNPGDIKLRVEMKDNILTFSVQNPVGKLIRNSLEEPGGIGLPNLRKRLALLYPGQHTLQITNTGETFAAVLRIHDLHSQPHERKVNLLYH